MRHSQPILALTLAALPGPALADACGTLMQAIEAQAKLPYAAAGDMTMAHSAPMHTEVVVTGGKMYVQVMGAWHAIPFSADQTIAEAKQKMAGDKHVCEQVGTDAVNGEATTIYTEHQDKPGAAQTRIWISDSRGIPLKFELKLPDGGTTQTLQYRYDNVQAPPGSK
jgi:outer membrane lipoprotein-sorting protein